MSCKYVENIMVYADPYHSNCVALVVPRNSELEKWAQESGIQYKSFPELCDKAEAMKEVQASLSKVSYLLKGLLLFGCIRFASKHGASHAGSCTIRDIGDCMCGT